MLSEQISCATPSQLDAHRRRQKFRSDIRSVSNGINVNTVDNGVTEPSPVTEAPVAPYLNEEETTQEAAPIEARYFPGSAKSIVNIICEGCGHYFSVDQDEIISPVRTTRVVKVRWVAFATAKDITGWSLPEIGRRFGRDHTTVLHAIRNVERLRAKDAEYDAKIRRLVADVLAVIRASNPEFAVPGERQRDVPEQQGQGARTLSVA